MIVPEPAVTASELTVRRTVHVPLPPERAFILFTTRMSGFWPAAYSIGPAPLADVVVEPTVGGRWYERGTDGSECDWGRVAAWEPPGRLVLVWQVGADWIHDPDLETEVEIRFTAEGPDRTRLDLVHHHLERYGDAGAGMREAFDSPAGWVGILERFTTLATP